MQITTAQSWNDLNEWQLDQIAHLYLNTEVDQFEKAYEKMILILFQKKPGFFAKIRLYKILRNITISDLEIHARFLVKKTDLHHFPEIKGLIKPAPRLGDITIKQFSAIDSFFAAYEKNKTEVHLNRFVASLYRLKKDFDELLLPDISQISRKCSRAKKERIALAYKFTRFLIWQKYPIIFPPPKKEVENPQVPVFKKKEPHYIPFEKIMIGLAMDELQPLGKKQDINITKIYEFMDVLTESILYYREKQKQHDKSN